MSLNQPNDVIELVEPAILAIAPTLTDAVATALKWECDPLDPDAPEDVSVTTSSRRMMRLAIAAADVGSRFAREGLQHDPVAWMLTPRLVFDGRTAMDACQDLRCFKRSVVLHALGLGLDADPDAIDDLLDEDGADATDPDVGAAASDVEEPSASDAQDVRLCRPQLLTCWLDVVQRGERLFAFCAIVTDRPGELVERIIGRYGSCAEHAEFAVGFDQTSPWATAMISNAMADTLRLAAADPGSPLASGLDVVVEQRFADRTMAA